MKSRGHKVKFWIKSLYRNFKKKFLYNPRVCFASQNNGVIMRERKRVLILSFLFLFLGALPFGFLPNDFSISQEISTYKTILNYTQQEHGDPYRLEKEKFLAEHYQIYNTGKGESKIKNIKSENFTFLSLNPDAQAIQVLRYVKSNGVKGPAGSGCCESDGSNCIVDTDRDWDLWEAALNQNLFWYVDGEMVRNPDDEYNGWAYIDIIDPEKKAKWIEALKEHIASAILLESENVDGFFADNFQVPFDGYAGFKIGDDWETFDIDSNPEYAKPYYAALVDMARELGDYFHSEEFVDLKGSRPYFMANAYNTQDEDTNPSESIDWRGINTFGVDNIMREDFSFKNNNKDFYSTERYFRSLKDFKNIVEGTTEFNMAPKDVVILDHLADNNDIAKRLYSTASYLLIANNDEGKGKAYHFVWGPAESGEILDYPEQLLDLGRPLETFKVITNDEEKTPEEVLTLIDYETDSILFKRNYETPAGEQATVLVAPYNPSTLTYYFTGTVEKLVISGGGVWTPEGNGGTLSWEPLTGTSYDFAPNTAMIIKTIPDTQPPTVSMTSPQKNATVSGIVKFSVYATDDVGMKKVKFDIYPYDINRKRPASNYIVSQSVTNPGPYFEYLWTTTDGKFPNGYYLLQARAYDTSKPDAKRTDVKIVVQVKN